ncbi:MAG: TolC family protein [Nitrospirota bacterium]
MLLPSRGIPLLLSACLLLAPAAGHALTLQEGLAIVTEQGRDVAIARSDEESAKSAVSLARSPWLPSLDIYGRETWLKNQPEARTPFGSMPTSQDQFSTFGFKATQVLYDFGKTSSSVNSAKYGLKAREAGTFRTRNRAALEFIVAYFDLLEANELLKVAQEEVTRYDAHGRDAAARFKAGVVTRNEVLQADVLLADSKQRLLTAENTRTLRAAKINSLLMRPLNEQVFPSEIVGHSLGPVTLDQAWAEAEQSNPDLRDLDARVRAKEESISSVRSEYLPTVYVSGGYEYMENQYQVHPDNWTVIAGVNINLFAGGSTSSKVGIARSEHLSLKLGREKLLDAVRLDVQAAWLDRESSDQKVQVAMAAVAQASENLRLQRLRYQQGVGTSTEVLDAVTLMTTAETNAWKANFGVKRAEAALQYTMGRDLAIAYGAK